MHKQIKLYTIIINNVRNALIVFIVTNNDAHYDFFIVNFERIKSNI